MLEMQVILFTLETGFIVLLTLADTCPSEGLHLPCLFFALLFLRVSHGTV